MNRLRWLMLTLMLLVLLVSVSGCAGPRVVLVPPGQSVRLASDARAYVYVKVDGEWVRSRNKVTIPHGWWAFPPGRDANDVD